MKSEHEIQKEIQVALSQHKCTVFRANVGKVQTIDGRWFDTGLPQGHPDLYGFRSSQSFNNSEDEDYAEDNKNNSDKPEQANKENS